MNRTPTRHHPAGVLLLALGLGCFLGAESPSTAPSAYDQDFQKVSPGAPPEDLSVLNGDFTVKQNGDNRYLQLAGEPLDTFGLLFGPANAQTADLSARISADISGKRFPEFGLGANDAGGCKLWVLPGQGKIELRKADQTTASAPFTWHPNAWYRLRLRVRLTEPAHWKIEGKIWEDRSPEPAEWTIATDDSEPPVPGRASVWGIPFSGKPILFDDLSYKPLPK